MSTITTPGQQPGLFDRLGLVGLASIEPVVLASLATQSTLLLIGTHGTGKSLLLERIAEALGLSWRHYNASLLNFDDLVGYPFPDVQGKLQFVQTPASVWGAQAVFIDEISRARPDIQNRLFPVIHERKVQGIALDGLEHRWAAMNPPPDRNSDVDLAHYAGSQELDLALADRFALHVVMPQWRAFEESEQERVILSALREPDTAIGQDLHRLLEQIRLRVPVVQSQWSGAIARYVRLLCRLLDEAGHVLSARRAVMIARNIVAVHAVRQAQAGSVMIDDSVWLAVLSSIPLAASGIRLPESMLLASHREAWRLAAVAPEDPLALILGERDPVRRVQLALACDALPEGELTSIVTDALTQLPEGARHALAEWLFETHGIDRLSVVAVDDIAKAYSEVACLQEVSESVRPNSKAHKLWQALHQRLARLAPDEPLTERKANLLVSLFANRRLQVEADIDRILEAFTTTRESLAAAGQAA